MADRARVGRATKSDGGMMGFCTQDSKTWIVEIYESVDVLPEWSPGLRKSSMAERGSCLLCSSRQL